MRQPVVLYLFVGLGSCLATLLLVPLFRRLAHRLGVVDRPGADRKVHHRVVPYLGGLPFYFSFLGVVLLIEVCFPTYSRPVYFPLCAGGTLVVLMGLYDDVADMSSLSKLVIELLIGGALFAWGIGTPAIAHPLGGTVNIGWLAVIVTPLWIAGVVNAVNFSDGLDGLAAGLVFICAASLFAVAYKSEQVVACIFMAYLMGATLGFLPYNFNPASIFMGDAGALFLGFVLATTTMVEEQKGVAVIALVVPMVVMAVPMLDTALSFGRRLLRARRGEFFTPDRDHLHHRLLNLGLTQRQVVLALYYVSGCMGLMAFILSVVPSRYGFLILVLAGLAILFGVIVLRFVEGLAVNGRRRQPAAQRQDGPPSA